ncbi:methyltransferase [Aeoliella mucimassa]|nr:methyltransferase [Aeoliella mucimassa]
MKSIVKRAVRVDGIWAALNHTVVPAAKYMEYARYVLAPQKLPPFDRDIFADKTVLHGNFAGMKYPDMLSIGSMLYPKLLGSYERELEPLIAKLCTQPYTEIVDIGCAEGYYAVGLAMRIPTARVFAFDTNSDATQLCKAMAAANGVGKRVEIGEFCDGETLRTLPYSGRALIVCDCEGYEKQLFDEPTVRAMAPHDLLIETHDFIDIEISTTLQRMFEPSHHVQCFTSIDDIQKAKYYDYPEIADMSLEHRRQVVRENRPAAMEWLYLTPKQADRV